LTDSHISSPAGSFSTPIVGAPIPEIPHPRLPSSSSSAEMISTVFPFFSISVSCSCDEYGSPPPPVPSTPAPIAMAERSSNVIFQLMMHHLLSNPQPLSLKISMHFLVNKRAEPLQIQQFQLYPDWLLLPQPVSSLHLSLFGRQSHGTHHPKKKFDRFPHRLAKWQHRSHSQQKNVQDELLQKCPFPMSG